MAGISRLAQQSGAHPSLSSSTASAPRQRLQKVCVSFTLRMTKQSLVKVIGFLRRAPAERSGNTTESPDELARDQLRLGGNERFRTATSHDLPHTKEIQHRQRKPQRRRAVLELEGSPCGSVVLAPGPGLPASPRPSNRRSVGKPRLYLFHCPLALAAVDEVLRAKQRPAGHQLVRPLDALLACDAKRVALGRELLGRRGRGERW